MTSENELRSEANNSELLKTNMTKLFWKYALLSLAGTMMSCIAVIMDGYFMGNGVGEMALAGIAVVITLMYFCLGLCYMFGVGASTLAGIKLGDGNREGAREVYGSILVFSVVLSVTMGVIALLFLNPFLRFLGATDAVLPYARGYAQFFFALFPLSVLGQIAYFFCRLAERPRAAAIIFVSSGMTAIIVEYILVFRLHWGTAASAISFVLGMAGTVLLIPYIQRTENPFKLSTKHLKIRMDYIWESVKIGFPMFLFNLCPLITTVIVNRQIMAYGGTDLHLSAFGIFNAYIIYVINCAASAIVAGIQPIACINYGAKRYDRLKQLIKVSVLQSFAVLLIAQILVCIFAHSIVSFFTGDFPELIEITVTAMRLYILAYAFGSVSTIVGGYYVGIGKNKLALLNSTTRVLIFAVPMLFIIPKFFGLSGVWLAQPFADILACIIAVVCIISEYRSFKRSEETV